MPKKLVPNPDYEEARFELAFVDPDGHREDLGFPPRRTNATPPSFTNFAQFREWFIQHEIPSHIEVEVPDTKTIPSPDWVTAPYSEIRLTEEQVKTLLPKPLVERLED